MLLTVGGSEFGAFGVDYFAYSWGKIGSLCSYLDTSEFLLLYLFVSCEIMLITMNLVVSICMEG